MPVNSEFDLHWKAFLYVSGDLSASESEDFENLLVIDQSARDAVGSAVELVQGIGKLSPEELRPLTSRTRVLRLKRAFWGVAFSAAAVLLAAVLLPGFPPRSITEANASSVALAWSGIRGGIEADWTAIVAGPSAVDSPEAVVAVDSELVVEATSERPLPSWLLSAASVRPLDSPSEEN